jgi:hypothetical protein
MEAEGEACDPSLTAGLYAPVVFTVYNNENNERATQ